MSFRLVVLSILVSLAPVFAADTGQPQPLRRGTPRAASLPALAIDSFTTQNNPAFVGTTVSYILVVESTLGRTINYTADFGDSSTAAKGTIEPGIPAQITHTFSTPGSFTVTASVTASESTDSATLLQEVPAPSSGGLGVKNISENLYEIINPINGLGIEMANSNGGVIQLNIDLSTFTRAGTTVSTDWGDFAGRSSTVPGKNPVHQFIKHGIFVATARIKDADDNTPRGKGRKMVVISSRETGENTLNGGGQGGGENQPAAREGPATISSAMKLRSLLGKFNFSGGAKDKVSLSCMIQLPAGLDINAPHEVTVGIGNVTTTTTVDRFGRGASAVLRNLKICYPASTRMARIARGGEFARFDVTLYTSGLINAGFDTEGIVADAPDMAGGRAVVRKIQVAILIDGVPFEALIPVNYVAPLNANVGYLSNR